MLQTQKTRRKSGHVFYEMLCRKARAELYEMEHERFYMKVDGFECALS